MRRVVGLREVATAAGVSIATVSNVLNKPELVAEATRVRVHRVMDEIGFVRNGLARQLRVGASTTLGMTVIDVANPFFADLTHACQTAAAKHGYSVVLGSSNQQVEMQDGYLDLFEEQRVGGILIAPVDGVSERMWRLRARKVPVVLLGIHADRNFCSVGLDGRIGGELAVRHLIERGRRRIAFLGGPLHQVEDRWIGAQRACAEHAGVSLMHLDTPDQSTVHGRRVAELIERMPAEERPDGVFAATDTLALGLMQALVPSPALSVPDDIAVVGYDDLEYAASASVPLTSIRQPTDLLADEAVRLVMHEASAGAEHVHEQIRANPMLVERDSTGRRGG